MKVGDTVTYKGEVFKVLTLLTLVGGMKAAGLESLERDAFVNAPVEDLGAWDMSGKDVETMVAVRESKMAPTRRANKIKLYRKSIARAIAHANVALSEGNAELAAQKEARAEYLRGKLKAFEGGEA